ncbi:polyprenol monophosphomannose synthase [Corynebacterium uterequi]|uniref:dolichyl-phosphate beta-D-mannosyltransferase n=1 Tax=Corynebacterium uterequi TaxID=1072256 RepID=A0A0G3HE91_9CORY|nr:polyprenol monophosphomannose synthase [Corynebacterium uterequi]AKK11070.1 glycosyl transferase [Corynebacterium uterequi]
MTKPSDSTLVIVPTYNEAENLPLMVRRITEATPEVHLLVVDDNSPDGTGDLADGFAAENDAIHVLHRTTKDGLLGAYLAGFRWGLEKGYQVLVEMDADGSHAPEQLPLLLAEIDDDADVVIGSRYIDGGEVVNWPRKRFLLSRLGNLYIGVALGTGLRDMTAGYRAIRREVLETLDLDELSNAGYIFQVDFAFRAYQAGFDVREVPITFTEREFGESKLDGSFVKDSLVEVTKWGVAHRTQQAKDMYRELSGLIGHQYRTSELSKARSRARASRDNVVNATREATRLLRHEFRGSGAKNLSAKARQAGEYAGDLAKEVTGLIKHEAGRRRH